MTVLWAQADRKWCHRRGFSPGGNNTVRLWSLLSASIYKTAGFQSHWLSVSEQRGGSNTPQNRREFWEGFNLFLAALPGRWWGGSGSGGLLAAGLTSGPAGAQREITAAGFGLQIRNRIRAVQDPVQDPVQDLDRWNLAGTESGLLERSRTLSF